MAMYKRYELPFEVERACKSSFVINTGVGHAFITNENLLEFLRNPATDYTIAELHLPNGQVQKWIAVKTFTLGFKKRLFGTDGHIAR